MFDLSKTQKVYIAVGYSDLRRGIDGFASIIQNTFHMNPQSNALFIFCGRRSDRIKALYWDTDGYILLYKRLEGGRYQWPRTTEELKELRLTGKSVNLQSIQSGQNKVIQPVQKQLIF